MKGSVFPLLVKQKFSIKMNRILLAFSYLISQPFKDCESDSPSSFCGLEDKSEYTKF